MKRKYAMMLCLAVILLVTGSLAGCGKDESSKETILLTVWHYYSGTQKESFDGLVNEFNETVGAEQGIVVDASNKGSVNELQEKVMDAIMKKVGAEEAPDIFAAYSDTAYTLDEMGALADIYPYLTEEERESFLSAYLEEGEFETGSIKIFPIAKSTESFFLNVTAWEEFSNATGADESRLGTWEGIAETAKAYYEWTDSLTEEPDDGKAFFGRDAMANYMIIGSIQLGHEIFHVEDKKVSCDIDKETFRKLWDNYYIPYINGYYTALGRFRSDDMKTGDLIAYVGSSSGAAYFPAEITNMDGSTEEIEGAVYLLPNFENAEPYAVQQGAGMVVADSGEAVEQAAVTFLKWFTEAERNMTFSFRSGYLPVKKEANSIEVLEKTLEELPEEYVPMVLDTVEAGLDTVNQYQLYTTPPFEGGIEARSILESCMQEKAEADLQQIQEKMEAGVSREEAVSEFDTDENFGIWFAGVEERLLSLME